MASCLLVLRAFGSVILMMLLWWFRARLGMFSLVCLVGGPVVWRWKVLLLVVIMLVIQGYRCCFIMIRGALSIVTLLDLTHSMILISMVKLMSSSNYLESLPERISMFKRPRRSSSLATTREPCHCQSGNALSLWTDVYYCAGWNRRW